MKCAKEIYKTFPRLQTLYLPSFCNLRELCQVLCIETSSAVWTQCIYGSVHLPQNISEGWTLVVVNSDSGGLSSCGIPANETSNIIILTSAE